MHPPALRLPAQYLAAIVLAKLMALTAQAWLSRVLLAHGFKEPQAHHLAYLVVPPILLLMLAPVLMEHRKFLRQLFSPRGLTLRLALAAVALGVTLRIVWWSQLIARVALGLTASGDPQAIAGPVMSFACPPLPWLLLGVLVMAIFIPLMEETVDRGLLQSAFVHRGPLPAILISALIFTVFHPPSSYVFVFLMGVVFGIQFWLTGSLWTTVITHATYNGLIQFDWRCLQGQWNPPSATLPQLVPGVTALLILVVACLFVVALLRYQRAGAQTAPAR
jgi:membrane protease YdiL (CAAX protease family)